MSKLSDLKKKTLKNYETQAATQTVGQNYKAANAITPPREEKKEEKDNMDYYDE